MDTSAPLPAPGSPLEVSGKSQEGAERRAASCSSLGARARRTPPAEFAGPQVPRVRRWISLAKQLSPRQVSFLGSGRANPKAEAADIWRRSRSSSREMPARGASGARMAGRGRAGQGRLLLRVHTCCRSCSSELDTCHILTPQGLREPQAVQEGKGRALGPALSALQSFLVRHSVLFLAEPNPSSDAPTVRRQKGYSRWLTLKSCNQHLNVD